MEKLLSTGGLVEALDAIASQRKSDVPKKDKSSVRFLHLRRKELVLETAVSELENDNINYVGVRFSATGGLTVAYRYVNDNVIQIAIARCNHKDGDLYRRQKGREYARARLDSIMSRVNLPLDGYKPVEAIIAYIYGKKSLRRNLGVRLVALDQE